MKSLMIMFMLSMLVQPVSVSACDMENEQGAAHHATMSDHDGKPDCCDTSGFGNEHGCNDMSSCSSCPAGLSLIYTPASNLANVLVRHFSHINAEYLAVSHAHPPFRPPIS